jgi:hypothetical protein
VKKLLMLLGLPGLAVAGSGLGAWSLFGGSGASGSPGDAAHVSVKGETILASAGSTAPGTAGAPAGTASSAGAKPSSATPPPAPQPPIPANPAKGVLQGVRTALNSSLPTGNKNTDKNTSDAINALDQSLGGPWAADGNHVAGKGGNVVFDNAKAAIAALLKVKAPPAPPPGPPKPPGKSGPSGVYADYINDIDYAMWLMASTAINDDSHCASQEVSASNSELSAGDARFAKGQFDEAADHYKNAWAHALNAAGTTCNALTMSITGSVSGLWPGAPASLVLTIQNLNGFNASVTGITIKVGDASASCIATNLVVGSFSGPLTVNAHSSSQTTIPINLSASAPTACQGPAKFPLAYTAQAVQS